MRPTLRTLVAAPLCALLLAGCVSTETFLDPAASPLAYSEIRKSAAPPRLRVTAEFQRNGTPRPDVDGTLRIHAMQALARSGAMLPVVDGGEGEIRIVVNNVADLGDAVGRGVLTGVTLGLAGTTLVDRYEASATVTWRGKTFHATARQALHTTIGRVDLPAGAQTLASDAGFARVVEQLTLRLLRDLQRDLG